MIRAVRPGIADHLGWAVAVTVSSDGQVVDSRRIELVEPDFPRDVATQRRAPYEARADAVMYRQLMAELAQDRGRQGHLYDARAVEGQAARLLGDNVLRRPRAQLGPPWTKDHRVALAATIVA